MQIKGIFFDLGGTLFSYSGRMGGGGIGFVLRELGIEASAEEVGKAWGAANKQVGERYGSERYFLHRNLFRDTMTRFLADFDHEPSPALLEEFHRRQLNAVVEHLPIRPECHEALQALKDAGLYLSIVSNIDDDYLDPLIEKNGLGALLDHWTSSEEAQSCKPDPDIFHYSIDKSGLHKDEVLFVGDSLHHDVAGADAVGLRSARIVEEGVVTPLTHGLQVTADPTFEITTLTDLLGIVEQHNGG